jgi:hypothetical protein
MLIRLSEADDDICWNYAKKITKHRPDHPTYATGYDRISWEDDPVYNNYMAAVAEMAVARMLDKPWNGGGLEAGMADVGPNIEVRHAKERHYGLVIKRKDCDSDFWNVLCYVFDHRWSGYQPGEVEVIGYYNAREGYLMAGQCQAEHCCYILNNYTRALGQRHLRRFQHEHRRL